MRRLGGQSPLRFVRGRRDEPALKIAKSISASIHGKHFNPFRRIPETSKASL